MSKCQCTLKKLNRLTTTLILALPSISCILLPMPILSKQERNYCVICHKLPGAVFFTDHFWEYRLGRQFLLSMHHSWLQQVKEPQGQLAWWLKQHHGSFHGRVQWHSVHVGCSLQATMFISTGWRHMQRQWEKTHRRDVILLLTPQAAPLWPRATVSSSTHYTILKDAYN